MGVVKQVDGWEVSRQCCWDHVMFSSGDVVLVDHCKPCLVESACREGAAWGCRLGLLVRVLKHARAVSTTANVWHIPPPGEQKILLLGSRQVSHAAMWDSEDADHLLVIER
jgi:hypothetical protein